MRHAASGFDSSPELLRDVAAVCLRAIVPRKEMLAIRTRKRRQRKKVEWVATAANDVRSGKMEARARYGVVTKEHGPISWERGPLVGHTTRSKSSMFYWI